MSDFVHDYPWSAVVWVDTNSMVAVVKVPTLHALAGDDLNVVAHELQQPGSLRHQHWVFMGVHDGTQLFLG
ncbi:hypothetical protein D3C76_1453580 [compost metagenome]